MRDKATIVRHCQYFAQSLSPVVSHESDTTQTALALDWWLARQILFAHVCVFHVYQPNGTLKMLDKLKASVSCTSHYIKEQDCLLESIAKVPDWQVAKTGWLLSLIFYHDSTIMAEAITTIQTQNSSINNRVLHSPLSHLRKIAQTTVIIFTYVWSNLN